MIKFVIKDNIVKYIVENPIESKAISTCLTVSIEGAHFSQKFQNGHWDGNIRFYDNRTISFNIGFLQIVQDYLDKKKIDYNIIDKTNFDNTLDNVVFNKILHQHQKEAAIQFFKYKKGIVKIPTRGGKTIFSAECFRLLHKHKVIKQAIFIVDTQDLLLQAIDDFSDYLNIDKKEIGVIQDVNFSIKPITIATIQTITSILNANKRKVKKELTVEELRKKRLEKNKRKNNLVRFMSTVDLMIVDECHEYSNKTRISILEKFKFAQWRLFLSATPYKVENQIAKFNLMKFAGKILYEVKESVLKERGVLSDDKIALITIDHLLNKNIPKNLSYREYQKRVITQNIERNFIILYIINSCKKLGLKILVLFTSVEHGYYFKSLLDETFVSGEDNKDTRKEAVKKFLNEKGGAILLASDIFKKGITIPEAQILLNVGGGKEGSNVIQKRGRVLGTTSTKTKALTVDIIDNYLYFGEHSLARIIAYEEKVGVENLVPFDTHDKDFFSDFRSFVANWFDLNYEEEIV